MMPTLPLKRSPRHIIRCANSVTPDATRIRAAPRSHSHIGPSALRWFPHVLFATRAIGQGVGYTCYLNANWSEHQSIIGGVSQGGVRFVDG